MSVKPLPLPVLSNNGNGNGKRRSPHPKRPLYDRYLPSRDMLVPMALLNTFRQVRGDSFRDYQEDIKELAASIAQRGLMHQISVADWDQSGLQSYLDVVRDLYGETATPQDALPYTGQEGTTRYLVLLAGHRRLAAIHMLREEGCSGWDDFISRHPETTRESLFEELFPGGLVKAMVFPDILAFEGMKTQIQENILHKGPPTPRQAQAIHDLYKLYKVYDVPVTMGEFAEGVGFSVQTVRQYLGFCDLPLLVQNMIDMKPPKLLMSHGYELSRFRRRLLSEGTPLTEAEADKEVTGLASSFSTLYIAYGKNRDKRQLASAEALRAQADTKVDSLVYGQMEMYPELVLTPVQEVSRRVNQTHVKGVGTVLEILRHSGFLADQQQAHRGAPYETKASREFAKALLDLVLTYEEQLAVLLGEDQMNILREALQEASANLLAADQLAPLLF